jgi:hypothetical protein
MQPGKKPAAPAPQLSVVEQIDAILQRYLLADPELADQDIHLRQDGAGGLRIVVDDHSYPSPKDIEDPKIQGLIKRALQDWERS